MFPLTTHTVFAHARVTLLSFFCNAPWDMSAITEIVTSLTIVQMSLCCDDGGWRLESLILMGIRQASEESALSSGGWMKRWVLGAEKRHGAPLVQESCSRPARQPKAVHILIHLTYTLTYFTTILQIKMQRDTNVIPRRTTLSEPVLLKHPESQQHSSHVLVYLSTQDQSSHWLLKWAN